MFVRLGMSEYYIRLSEGGGAEGFDRPPRATGRVLVPWPASSSTRVATRAATRVAPSAMTRGWGVSALARGTYINEYGP